MRIEQKEIMELLDQVPLFSNLAEPQLNRLAGLFNQVIFLKGEVIFNIDDPSEEMFVLCEGQVILKHGKQGEEKALATLHRGDVFGEEALLYDDSRYYSAVACVETVLLRINVDDYLTISDKLSGIEETLEVAVHSRRLSAQVHLPWLHEDEYVHVMTRRHPAKLWTKMPTPIFFGVGVLLLSFLIQSQWLPERPYGWIILAIGLPAAILWVVWSVIDWRNDYFIVTNKRVVWIEKIALIYESRQEAPLRTIMSVGLQRSRVGSLLDYADVVVMTFVGTIRLRDLAHAEIIASLIESYWHRSESLNQREESQMMSQILHEKLDLAWGDDEETQATVMQEVTREPTTPVKEPGFIAWLFSDFIRLRYESDGAIIYRKHWFVLIEKTWLPVVLMLIALATLAGRIGGRLTFLPITAAILGLMLLQFALFVWIMYQYADWRNDIFKITLDQIIDIDRKPLGKIRRRSAPLENVLSIEYERLGFWGFLFNFGTVYISVGNSRLSFDHVYNPSEVQQDIFYRMGERLETIRQFTIESERERVSEWIASYHKKTTLRGNRKSDQHLNDK